MFFELYGLKRKFHANGGVIVTCKSLSMTETFSKEWAWFLDRWVCFSLNVWAHVRCKTAPVTCTRKCSSKFWVCRWNPVVWSFNWDFFGSTFTRSCLFRFVVLTFESLDEIPWCDHLNETSLAVLLIGTIRFYVFYKIRFRIFLKFSFWPLLGVKGLAWSWVVVEVEMHAVSTIGLNIAIYVLHACFCSRSIALIVICW